MDTARRPLHCVFTIAASAALGAIVLVGPALAGVAGAADGGGGGGGDIPWWPGVVTGIGAAAALAFALWPARARSRRARRSGKSRASFDELRQDADRGRADVERIVQDTSARELRALERAVVAEIEALRASAASARTEMDRIIEQWASGGRARRARPGRGRGGDPDAVAIAVEAFERLQRAHVRSLRARTDARAESLRAFATARQEIERVAAEAMAALDAAVARHLSSLDASGRLWSGRIEHAGERAARGSSRRRRARRP